ncbi:Fungalysin metallopeptidase-domain-containing protein [Armillaria novae-zelandiae]|uniref:Extracellular metalloproteinase n=1 Tax=Armillaria novae-zelandiae TaxID=153914 RepID=A0AA39P1P7_9AGAR|nr:Fungalysin metallopeptidase-domain-containing protein [Armillaria novae-zelandiae]
MSASKESKKLVPEPRELASSESGRRVEASKTLLGTHNGITSLEYLVQPDGSVALAHVVQVHNDDTNAWYEAFIDAHSGEILSMTDFVTEATAFTVDSITKDAIIEGEETLVDPEDIASSASGWIMSNQTAGNNVIAYKYSQSATTFESYAETFDYSKTQISEREEHRVIAGQSGTCRMYIWTLMTPNRDGALQNDIIVHEFTHGITNRLTGGGTGRCLQTLEAGGMGEGQSDAMAVWTEHKDSTVPDYVLATWVFNNPAGIRCHPYSTNASGSCRVRVGTMDKREMKTGSAEVLN